MRAQRPAIPARIKREVLVQAHHRCAICQEPAYDIHHITEWSKGGRHTLDNLIALCPNCHRRVHRGEIDRPALRRYKANLSIVNEPSAINRDSQRSSRSLIDAELGPAEDDGDGELDQLAGVHGRIARLEKRVDRLERAV
jgi:hypothetical protein